MNVKVKIFTVTSKQAQRIALNILDPLARMGWVVSATPRLTYMQERDSLSNL